MAKTKTDFGGFGFTDKMVFGESPVKFGVKTTLGDSPIKFSSKRRKKGRGRKS